MNGPNITIWTRDRSKGKHINIGKGLGSSAAGGTGIWGRYDYVQIHHIKVVDQSE